MPGMRARLPNRPLKRLLLTVWILGILILALAVAKSGMLYMLDNDEVSHIQTAYLMNRGDMPFRSFFTVYPPIFDRLLTPILSVLGNSFQTISVIRIFMVVLFFVRTALIALLTATLFGIMPALLFIPLYLSDAFTTFSGSQIRPDNLMLTLFVAGLTLFVLPGRRNTRTRTAAASGLLITLSALVLMKIVPSVLAAFAVIGILLTGKRAWREVAAFFGTGLAAILGYLGWFAWHGTLATMIQNTVLDARTTNNALLYPVRLGSYYYANNNAILYGTTGTPPLWIYAWILPVIGFIGAYQIVHALLQQTRLTRTGAVQLILVVSLAAQWGSLFFINSVFLQYYIPVTWLFAVFGSVTLWQMYTQLSAHRRLQAGFAVITAVTVGFLGYSAFNMNLMRATMDNTQTVRYFSDIWQQTAPDEPTFPNMLFRPLAYPLPYGYFIADIPQSILERYPSLPTMLEKVRVRHLFIDDYTMQKLSGDTQAYISTHYQLIPASASVWVRNN